MNGSDGLITEVKVIFITSKTELKCKNRTNVLMRTMKLLECEISFILPPTHFFGH